MTDTPTQEIPIHPKPPEEPEKTPDQIISDQELSLQSCRTYIQGLENILSDLLPGWDECEDERLPELVAAFKAKYRLIEERSARVHRSLEASKESEKALGDQVAIWRKAHKTLSAEVLRLRQAAK